MMGLHRVLPRDNNVYADPDLDLRYDVIPRRSEKERIKEHPYATPTPAAACGGPRVTSPRCKTSHILAAAFLAMSLFTIVTVTSVVVYFNIRLDLQTEQFMQTCQMTKQKELNLYTPRPDPGSITRHACKTQQTVLFSASLTRTSRVAAGSVLRYDTVLLDEAPAIAGLDSLSSIYESSADSSESSDHSYESSFGSYDISPGRLARSSGSYDRSTGEFTSPLPGFYLFQVNAVAALHGLFSLQLQKNNRNILHIFADLESWKESVSKCVVLHLEKGDSMRVVSVQKLIFLGPGGYTTFSGYLVSEAFANNTRCTKG